MQAGVYSGITPGGWGGVPHLHLSHCCGGRVAVCSDQANSSSKLHCKYTQALSAGISVHSMIVFI